MKLGNFLSPGILALGLSCAVTAGSMYVTVNAASNNSAAILVQEKTATPTSMTSTSSALSSVTVELAADGSLSGRFSNIETGTGELNPADGVRVSLISGSGDSRDTVSRKDGTFSFSDVGPGVFTVHADSPQGRLAYGIRTIRSYDSADAASEADPVPTSLSLQMDFGLAPSRDLAALGQVIKEVRPDKADDAEAKEEAKAIAEDTNYVETSFDADLAEGSIGHEQLRLNEDGSLDGHVTLLNPDNGNIAPVTDLTVSFITDNRLSNSTRVQPDGSFVQENLLPGVYTCVIAGKDGISYMGVDVVANNDDNFVPTAMRQGGFGAGVVQDTFVEEYVVEEVVVDDDDDDGGFLPFDGGGGGGALGGGAAGAGGGLGPLLLLGGLGAGIAALVNDDNNVIPPATPGG